MSRLRELCDKLRQDNLSASERDEMLELLETPKKSIRIPLAYLKTIVHENNPSFVFCKGGNVMCAKLVKVSDVAEDPRYSVDFWVNPDD